MLFRSWLRGYPCRPHPSRRNEQQELVKSAASLLGVDEKIVAGNLLPLVATNDIFIEEGSDGRRVYSFNMYTFEENLATYINRLSKAKTSDLRVDINNL